MITPPVSADVPVLPGKGTLYIDTLTDTAGNAVTAVIDIDVGFKVTGHLELPGSLSGKGVVRLAADEIGGPFNQVVGEAQFAVTGASTPNDPPVMRYDWSITVQSPTIPDESEMYHFGLVFLLQTLAGGHTDIGGFYDLGPILVV
jgi:hypothetical protein